MEDSKPKISAATTERLNKSRSVLYDAKSCKKDYVDVFSEWAQHYDEVIV